jgi:integrase
MPLFSVAAREWLDSRTGMAPKSIIAYRQYVASLTEQFGQRLVCDIDERDIATLQRKRLAEGKAGRTVNYETGTLRQILKAHGLWGTLTDKVRALRERHDVGRAIPREHEERIIQAASQSRSPALLPLFILSVDSGLRASEVRSLRRKDLKLAWADGVIVAGELSVPKSKTDAGTGRIVPLTRRACGALTLWLSRFPDSGPDGYVFPRCKVGVAGNGHEPYLWDVDASRPIGQWKKAWARALKKAGLDYRWHDCRHTFVTRLAENPSVSEETIRALAGHVSKRMLERYSHIRVQAKQAAIAALERDREATSSPDSQSDGAQNWAQPAPTPRHLLS